MELRCDSGKQLQAVASNGSRFVHASNVLIARPLYPGIVISGRDDIYPERATKKLEPTRGQSQHHDFFSTGFFEEPRNLEVKQIADKSGYLFRQNCPQANLRHMWKR